ncbi:hypothetical protein N7488_011342 [Penicillium malachiteum]|nr:hypothetical protein N7488_011342 [Penicillium malachiteum]
MAGNRAPSCVPILTSPKEIVHMVSYLVRPEFRQLAELIIGIQELADQLLSYERGNSDLTINWIRKQQKAVMESTNMVPSDFEAIYIAAGLSEELKSLMST